MKLSRGWRKKIVASVLDSACEHMHNHGLAMTIIMAARGVLEGDDSPEMLRFVLNSWSASSPLYVMPLSPIFLVRVTRHGEDGRRRVGETSPFS